MESDQKKRIYVGKLKSSPLQEVTWDHRGLIYRLIHCESDPKEG